MRIDTEGPMRKNPWDEQVAEAERELRDLLADRQKRIDAFIVELDAELRDKRQGIELRLSELKICQSKEQAVIDAETAASVKDDRIGKVYEYWELSKYFPHVERKTAKRGVVEVVGPNQGEVKFGSPWWTPMPGTLCIRELLKNGSKGKRAHPFPLMSDNPPRGWYPEGSK